MKKKERIAFLRIKDEGKIVTNAPSSILDLPEEKRNEAIYEQFVQSLMIIWASDKIHELFEIIIEERETNDET